MRKEFIFAIIFGITLGLILTFGIWRANSALKSSAPKEQTDNSTTPNKEESSENNGLTIIRPGEDDVVTSSPITISGITKANSTLIISAEEEDYIVKTSQDGSFEEEIDLVGGVNEILFAFEDKQAPQTKSLRVIYSSEFEESALE